MEIRLIIYLLGPFYKNNELYLIQIQEVIEYSREKMKSVDSLGHYEADDETGFIFKEIKDIMKKLNQGF